MDLPIVEYSEQRRPTLKASTISDLLASSTGQEQALYVLLAATGMRISEALALEGAPLYRWRDARSTSSSKSKRIVLRSTSDPQISDTSGCVIFRRLSIAPVSVQPWEDFQLNHLVLALLVAARFADPIVSLQPYQFARDRTN
jgi:hypothetical protein